MSLARTAILALSIGLCAAPSTVQATSCTEADFPHIDRIVRVGPPATVGDPVVIEVSVRSRHRLKSASIVWEFADSGAMKVVRGQRRGRAVFRASHVYRTSGVFYLEAAVYARARPGCGLPEKPGTALSNLRHLRLMVRHHSGSHRRHPCFPHWYEVVARRMHDVVLLFNTNSSSPPFWVGCWGPTGRRTYVVTDVFDESPPELPPIQIAGRYVATIDIFDEGTTSTIEGKVLDLATGHFRFFGGVERIRVSDRGVAAYVVRDFQARTRLLVAGTFRSIPRPFRLEPRVGGHVIAVGPGIRARSVYVRGAKVYWRDAAGAHVAPAP